MTFFHEELEKIKEQGLLRSLRNVPSNVVNFCSNDYLGLAKDPRLAKAAAEAARRYGAGSGAARLISGNSPLADELEDALARLKGTEAALLFNSGYHANIGVLPAIAGEGAAIFSDELNHASLIDGCRLSKAETVVYRHNDLDHLEELLKCRGAMNCAPTKKIIVTEAVFSMEGDVCPLDDLLNIAERYDALVYLDEAHAVGVFGERGEGLAGVRHASNRLICMGTLGKAFGSYGAFVAGTKTLRDYLINKARSFIFTTALPPAVLGASIEAVKIVEKETERRKKLWDNVHTVGARLIAPLQKPRSSLSPIFSIPIGPAEKTMTISGRLLEQGIFLQGIRPPTVSEGTSRLRLTVSAAHTPEQIERLNLALKRIFEE